MMAALEHHAVAPPRTPVERTSRARGRVEPSNLDGRRRACLLPVLDHPGSLTRARAPASIGPQSRHDATFDPAAWAGPDRRPLILATGLVGTIRLRRAAVGCYLHASAGRRTARPAALG